MTQALTIEKHGLEIVRAARLTPYPAENFLVYFDFETFSEAELNSKAKNFVTAYQYSRHKSTGLLCYVYAYAGTKPVRGIPEYRKTDFGMMRIHTFDETLESLAANPKVVFVAHNAAFERYIWQAIMVEQYGYSPIPIERWKCTQAKSYYHSLPPSLKGAAIALNLKEKKDEKGKDLLLKLSKPRRKEGSPWWYPEDAPQDFEDLYSYCEQDVVTMRELDRALRDIPASERSIWCIDQRINEEGLCIDHDMVRRAMKMQEEHKDRLLWEFTETTGLNSPNQVAELGKFINKVNEDAGCAERIPDMQAETVERFLDKPLPDLSLRLLRIRQETSKSSLAKLPKMLQLSQGGNRLRDAFVYHRAHTGRWGSFGVQVHNLFRPLFDIQGILETLEMDSYENFSFLYPDDEMDALASATRGMIVAPEGCRFLGGDLAQMEARVIAWLAGDEAKLETFRQDDIEGKTDNYCRTAQDLYGYPVTKKMKERQTGKVAVLAFGYQGAIPAMVKFSKTYRLDLRAVATIIWASATAEEKEEAKRSYAYYLKKAVDPISPEIGLAADVIKQRWRNANPMIVQFWEDLNHSACQAVLTGKPQKCGKLTWFMHGKFLFCKMPSGKCVAYPYPKVKITGSDWNPKYTLSYVLEKKKALYREGTYGGKLAENLTQAVQRELLIEAMERLEPIYPVNLHVHDELVSPVRLGFGSIEEYMSIMKIVEPHHAGIPVNVSGWEGMRFGKA